MKQTVWIVMVRRGGNTFIPNGAGFPMSTETKAFAVEKVRQILKDPSWGGLEAAWVIPVEVPAVDLAHREERAEQIYP